jgi:hypothetical protein
MTEGRIAVGGKVMKVENDRRQVGTLYEWNIFYL